MAVGRRRRPWRDSFRSLLDPTFLFIGWAFLAAAAAPLVEYLLLRRPQILALNILGGALIVAAGTLIAEANLALGPAYTPFVDGEAAARELVARRIYKYIRHPIYLAGGLLTAGAALMLNSRWAWLFTGMCWLAYAVRIRREEKLLARNMPGYVDYMRRTKRFIPWVF